MPQMPNADASRFPLSKAGLSALVIAALDWIGRLQVVKDLLTAALGVDSANALTSWWLPPTLAAVGIFLILKKQRHRTTLLRGIGLSLEIFAVLLALAFLIRYLTTPHLQATNGLYFIAHIIEGPQPRSCILFPIHITNSGKPSTTGNWGLTVTFNDGEVFQSAPLVGEHDNSLPGSLGRRHFTRDDDITVKTANSPITQGAGVDGYVYFDLPGIRTETLLQPGTILDVEYRDVAGKKYTFREVVPAKEIPVS
jgi:hypothetical protein